MMFKFELGKHQVSKSRGVQGKQTGFQAPVWHTMMADEILKQLKTNPKTGLSLEQVQKRFAEYGPNTLPIKRPPTVGEIFLHQFKSPLIYILLIAAIVSIVIGDAKDATFIFAVLLLNAALGTFQEWRAEKGAAALQSLVKTEAHVLRDGQKQDVSHEELVSGDVVYLAGC